jgi:hypothetical protein
MAVAPNRALFGHYVDVKKNSKAYFWRLVTIMLLSGGLRLPVDGAPRLRPETGRGAVGLR